ncbi:RNA polymerase sigma factor [Sphaerisporangium fuscum]|uniref:RNA polymerase sigma factor n=1 Tax=Sphaerisporangium fuscum TaxID=2835868 RepID=UPI001BDD085C|nr:RNA polymerase sigma factor [Sphaerisporangium fuscum]
MTAELGAAEDLTDAQLARDPALFSAIYDRHFRDIYRYIAGRLDVQAADDLAAETFLIAFHGRDKFDPERGGLRPWLFGIATNLVSKHRRQEARHYRALVRAGAEPATDSHESRVVSAVSARRLQPQLAKALMKLTRGERDVLLLMALSQLSHEEIAQSLQISYGTVGSRLSRARKKLRTALEDLER